MLESGKNRQRRESGMMRGVASVLAVLVVMMVAAGCQKGSPYQSPGSSSTPAGESADGPAASSSAPPTAGASNDSGNVAGTAPGAATPAEFSKGEALFNADCAACHGQDAMGTDHGPPLVHPIYQPDHHSDASFRLAIRNGARSHHWMFGNMPPVQGVNDDDATRIVAYVRWLQHTAGIF
jgi:mono/diheme cytochrome c family protein